MLFHYENERGITKIIPLLHTLSYFQDFITTATALIHIFFKLDKWIQAKGRKKRCERGRQMPLRTVS